jgi:hypothetical protein
MVPHFEHSMIDPYNATGQSSGHWSTSTKALCRHVGHDTASVARTFARVSPSVVGSIGTLRRGATIRLTIGCTPRSARIALRDG